MRLPSPSLLIMSLAISIPQPPQLAGFLIYYRFFAKSASAASYVVSALTLTVGVVLAISAILRIVKIKKDEEVAALGKSVMAKFISYGTDKTSGKVAIYYIEYSYDDNP